MEFFENKLSPCFERSTTRESVPLKDKPSPLRIIKRRQNYGQQRTFKGNSAYTGVDYGPRESLDDGEPPRVSRLPRRRPKPFSAKRNGHAGEESAGYRQSSQESTFEHSLVSRSENDNIPGQDKSPPLPSYWRYSLKMKKLRRKRPSLKSNIENGVGDCISSTCTLPIEHSNMWLNDSSRASSRCTYHELGDFSGLAESPCLPTPFRAEKTTLVLSPHINVVPETMSMRAGQQHLWVAIEVSGRLFPAYSEPGNDRVPCPDKGL